VGKGIKPIEGSMIKYTVSFSSEATDETYKAYLWYKQEKPGLEKEFRENLRIKIDALKENPKSSTFIYKSVRTSRMKIFPYNIIYRISNLNIQVIAVFHHSRNPREWKKRI
jgi:toxin ParE1/3/4